MNKTSLESSIQNSCFILDTCLIMWYCIFCLKSDGMNFDCLVWNGGQKWKIIIG